LGEAYYLRQVPQSEYRRLKKSDSKIKAKSNINIKLDNLKIKDPEIKAALRENVLELYRSVVEAMMPEDRWIGLIEDGCLQEIYRKLGING